MRSDGIARAVFVACAGGAIALFLAGGAARAQEYDPATGFFVAPGYELVIGNCIACHSARLVTQQGLTRDGWAQTIEWMQAEQGLWPIADDSLSRILDYLSTHYGPARPHFGRR